MQVSVSKSECGPYLGPVAEGQHQRDKPGLQSGQGSQVVGSEAGQVVTGAHLTGEPTAHRATKDTETLTLN